MPVPLKKKSPKSTGSSRLGEAILAKVKTVFVADPFGVGVWNQVQPHVRTAINAAVGELLPSLVDMRELGAKGTSAIELLLRVKLIVDSHRERLEAGHHRRHEAVLDEVGEPVLAMDVWTDVAIEMLHADLTEVSRQITADVSTVEYLHLSRRLKQHLEDIRAAA